MASRAPALIARDRSHVQALAPLIQARWANEAVANEGVEPAPRLLTRDQLLATTDDSDDDGDSSAPRFRAARGYFPHLSPATRFGQLLCYSHTIGSTQTFLTTYFGGVHAHAAFDGMMCVADIQTAGRGRSKNTWMSPAGSLSFSFKSKFRSGASLPFVQYLASLAAVRALNAEAGCDLGVRIKWPNDLYAVGLETVRTEVGAATDNTTTTGASTIVGKGAGTDAHTGEGAGAGAGAGAAATAGAAAAEAGVPGHGRPTSKSDGAQLTATLKVGGILCTSTFQDGQFDVTTGIGLNFSNEHPTVCLDALLRRARQRTAAAAAADTDVAMDVGVGVSETGGGGHASKNTHLSRERFLAFFANVFGEMYEIFEVDGFAPFREAYLEQWLHTGQRVVVKGRDGEADAQMTIEGLTASGALLTVDASGEQFELYPDGNSFDFFAGLIKQKL